jgi:16S rRNA (uracil1498-N3)-methyltransferase
VKQCGRAVVPTVQEVRDFHELLSGGSARARFMLVEPGNDGGASPSSIKDLERQPPPAAATIFIGPEGGWTTAEVQTAVKAGVVPVTLGMRTLRADAAGAAAIALLQYIWGDL